jgi:hypothetical protein
MFFDSWGFREKLRQLVDKINRHKKELRKNRLQPEPAGDDTN